MEDKVEEAMEEKEFHKKRDLLSFYFQKYLQYKITTIFLIFTFIIGIVIAFLTQQMNVRSLTDWILVFIVSVVVVGTGIILIDDFEGHLHKIILELKEL